MKKTKILKAVALAGMCAVAPAVLFGCAKAGEDGQNGQNGKSAYEIAVENGFEGTELEWLESLKATNEESVHTVKFDYNLGFILDENNPWYKVAYKSDDIEAEDGDWITLPNIEEKHEHLVKYFKGWYTGTTVYDTRFTNYTPVHDNLTLYAMWDEEELKKDLYATEGLEMTPYSNGVHITSYTGDSTEVSIPRIYRDGPVLSKVVVISDSTTFSKIEKLNFCEDNYISGISGNFPNLTTVTGDLNRLKNSYGVFKGSPFMENGIKNAENGIFIKWGIVFDGKTTTLSEVELNNVRIISDEAFKGNTNITKLTLKGQIEHIGNQAFADCSNLVEVKSENKILDTAGLTFINCVSLEIADISMDLGFRDFENTSINEYVINDEVDFDYLTFSSSDRGVFANNLNASGVTLIVKSEELINEILKPNKLNAALNFMQGVGKIIVDVSLHVDYNSLLNNTEYFTKDGNIYTYIYQAE